MWTGIPPAREPWKRCLCLPLCIFYSLRVHIVMRCEMMVMMKSAAICDEQYGGKNERDRQEHMRQERDCERSHEQEHRNSHPDTPIFRERMFSEPSAHAVPEFPPECAPPLMPF